MISGFPSCLTITSLDARHHKTRQVGPVTDLGRVASNANPDGMARGRAVQDEELVPSRRADAGVGGCRNLARRARTGKGGEDGALAHVVAMGGADGSDEGDLGGASEVGGEGEGDGLTVGPVLVLHGEGGLGCPGQDVVGREVLEPIFLGVDRVLRVGTRYQDAAVGHENRLGVVQARNGRARELRHAGADRLGWIIQHSRLVRIRS